MNFGGGLNRFIATSCRHHFSHHLRSDFSSLHFLYCYFTTATDLIRLPTAHLSELEDIVPNLPGAFEKGIIIEKFKTCSNLRQLESIYAFMVKNSYNQDCFMINQFASACSTFSQTDYAIQALTQMNDPNIFVYNAVIRACVSCFAPIQSLQIYLRMLRAQISPSSYTFPSIIKSCALISQLRIGEAINAQIWKFGFKSHVFVQTSLIDFYSSFSKIFESRQVFDEMIKRDAFVWTSMISVHAKSGNMVSAHKLFDEMPEPERTFATWNSLIDGYARIKDIKSAEFLFNNMPSKDLISWTTMINSYSQNKLYQESLSTFNQMTKQGITPDEITMATVISACAHLGTLDIGKKIHLYIAKNRFNLDVYIGSALIDMYAKCGNLDQSLLVFYKLPEKNLFCWNSIIEGLASHGYAKESLKMFTQMKKEYIKPNGITFISVLTACTHGGLVKEGRMYFQSMIQDFLIPRGIEHYGCMVDLLCKAGMLEDAMELIKGMELEPNGVIWGAVLNGCRIQKNLDLGRVAVEKLMVLEPDNSGYYSLFVKMLAEENRWSEVARIRSSMKEFRVEKKSPGSSWIEIEGKSHQFSASDKYHECSKEIYLLLDRLYGKQLLDACVFEYDEYISFL
ncbi:hypothetical protein LXL04_014608 [Taraxacum kok-saghyz]